MKSIDIAELSIPSDGVLVIWEWNWMAGEKTQESDTSRSPSEAEILSSDAEEDRNQPALTTVTHTVTFKVIGCTREQVYQEILRNVRDTLEQGHDVPILLTPEATNSVDSKAIKNCIYMYG